jgi:hypothetical protein
MDLYRRYPDRPLIYIRRPSLESTYDVNEWDKLICDGRREYEESRTPGKVSTKVRPDHKRRLDRPSTRVRSSVTA